MLVTVCPAATVNASAERVWSLLIDPRKVGQWADARFEAAEPDGPARVGQRWRFSTAAFGRRWPVTMTVTSVPDDRRSLGLDVALPLGIVNQELVTIAPLADGRTRVQLN